MRVGDGGDLEMTDNVRGQDLTTGTSPNPTGSLSPAGENGRTAPSVSASTRQHDDAGTSANPASNSLSVNSVRESRATNPPSSDPFRLLRHLYQYLAAVPEAANQRWEKYVFEHAQSLFEAGVFDRPDAARYVVDSLCGFAELLALVVGRAISERC